PHHGMSLAKDFVRLHPNEETHWSCEFCFVHVPIKGQKRETLHLIEEPLAMRHLSNGVIQRFRLALATKPNDVFFLCHVPSQHLDSQWNGPTLRGWLQAKTLWTRLVSRRDEGVDGYATLSAILAMARQYGADGHAGTKDRERVWLAALSQHQPQSTHAL